MKICEERNISWEDYWKENEDLKMYMCHGKDNIPFHTMILPGLLLALDENYHLPDVMVASQYVNIDSEKISKSKGNGITILDMIKEYDVDSLRYYMIAYGPENADINFTMENYINVHNSDLVNKFGNFVNRTLNFKGLETIISGNMDNEITDIIVNKYDIISKYIEKLEIKSMGEKQKVAELSGGNQQKVCMAKAFTMEPNLLFVSEPTRGIDVGAKQLVLETLKEYNRERNTTIVVTSSEIEELRSICDRIAIINEGKVAGILPATASILDFGKLMSGIKEGE